MTKQTKILVVASALLGVLGLTATAAAAVFVASAYFGVPGGFRAAGPLNRSHMWAIRGAANVRGGTGARGGGLRGGLGRGGLSGGGFTDPEGRPMNVVAKLLGIKPEDLWKEHAKGKTLAEIAKAKGVGRDEVIDAIVDARKKGLDEAVKAGRVTKAQADDILKQIKERVAWMVDNGKPGNCGLGSGRRGRFGPGMMGGFGRGGQGPGMMRGFYGAPAGPPVGY